MHGGIGTHKKTKFKGDIHKSGTRSSAGSSGIGKPGSAPGHGSGAPFKKSAKKGMRKRF